MKSVIILGIETSCDETAVAIVKDGVTILANAVQSQIDIHRKFGGVVPEIASRQHIENIGLILESAFIDAGLGYEDIDAVAVTNRPGLIGALLVGVSFAKAFSYGLNKPLIAINHLEGHIYANFLEHQGIMFPAICLLVSGGHTSIIYSEKPNSSIIIGATRDDAAGEAFDKIARFLNLGYPGGPVIQESAKIGQLGKYKLPRPLLDHNSFEFSFSGLKTATINQWKNLQSSGGADINSLVAEFQEAVIDVLLEKTFRAAEQYRAKSILLAGGVAANSRLRERMLQRGLDKNLKVYYPSVSLCTDNAAMVAGLGYQYYRKQKFSDLSLNAFSGL